MALWAALLSGLMNKIIWFFFRLFNNTSSLLSISSKPLIMESIVLINDPFDLIQIIFIFKNIFVSSVRVCYKNNKIKVHVQLSTLSLNEYGQYYHMAKNFLYQRLLEINSFIGCRVIFSHFLCQQAVYTLLSHN